MRIDCGSTLPPLKHSEVNGSTIDDLDMAEPDTDTDPAPDTYVPPAVPTPHPLSPSDDGFDVPLSAATEPAARSKADNNARQQAAWEAAIPGFSACEYIHRGAGAEAAADRQKAFLEREFNRV